MEGLTTRVLGVPQNLLLPAHSSTAVCALRGPGSSTRNFMSSWRTEDLGNQVNLLGNSSHLGKRNVFIAASTEAMKGFPRKSVFPTYAKQNHVQTIKSLASHWANSH